MIHTRVVFALMLWFITAASATIPTIVSQSVDPNNNQITVNTLQIIPDGNDVILEWTPLLNRHSITGVLLTEYRIYFGRNPYEMILLSTTTHNHFRHRNASEQSSLFFQVLADYSGQPNDTRFPFQDPPNTTVLLSFDEGELNLLPYSDDEDIDPDDWDFTDEETLHGNGRSLRLSGNTWKRLSIHPTPLTDNSVWSIGILSVDGDTLADLQAFGIGDGESELFYSFHGMRGTVVWQEPWIVSYQDAYPRGEWHIYRLAVGYDWSMRYGNLPLIDELYFINDNDNNDPPSIIYFDELTDITASIPPEPDPVISCRYLSDGHRPMITGMGGRVAFQTEMINRSPGEVSLHWEFGDGMTSDVQNPEHLYHFDGNYTVALTATDRIGLTGRATTIVEIGDNLPLNSITIGCTGDVMLARRYERQGGLIQQFGPETVFERIQSRINELDLAIINLESVLTDEGEPHPTKGIIFRGQPENVAGLVYAGFDIATLANNHVIDYGQRGMEETQDVLDAAGIGHCGAGINEYNALQPVFRTVQGLRIGVLSYCNRTGRDYNQRPFMDAGYDRYGYAYFSADNLIRSVPDAAEQCDLLIVFAHGGWEYADEPVANHPDEIYPSDHEERIRYTAHRDSATIELEHLAIDLGAGLVIGSHPHVLQGFEVYDGVVIAHSMGNFAFDQNFFETWPSALVCAEMDHHGVSRVWVEPIFVDNYRPTPAVGSLGRKILDRLAGYSTDLNTLVISDYDQMHAEVVINPDPEAGIGAEYAVSGRMRYNVDDEIYRSEPLRMDGGGFPTRIVSIDPFDDDQEWMVSLGREILLVGNMEREGAQIWNYNTNWEGSDEEIVHSGTYSSSIIRPMNWQDAITDLTQRIPVNAEMDRLTLCGWLNTENARNAGIAARFYRYRYNNEQRYITGEQVAEGRLQGDNDWTYLWDDLILPAMTEFLNVRWQLFGPAEGQGQIWCDDIELIRWEDWTRFEDFLEIDAPSDLYYLQVATQDSLENVEVTYRTVRFGN
ncbi:MAG: CapA family protein [Candidatus Electryoneaceae bacterium]|nr:CapA family protein [Candidatus Electryoneaceae bacterium]